MIPLYVSLKSGTPSSGYWDQAFLADMLLQIPSTDRRVFVIPGAYQGDIIPEINNYLSRFPKIMVFVTSDEECKFDVEALEHPDMVVYSQYGNRGIAFPIGYRPGTPEILKSIGRLPKTINWSFAGQVTHHRRKLMANYLRTRSDGVLQETSGFAKGMEQTEYLTLLARSKVVLCPPGPISQDSFRLYEALEAGCIPIVDDVSPVMSGSNHYVRKMLDDAPFPIFSDYKELPELIDYCLRDPMLGSRVQAWWINRKYRWKNMLKTNLGVPLGDTAVVVPVSPIPSHPSTEILDETLSSVRHHMSSPILITFDGVRKEQEAMKPRYQEFIRNALWNINFNYMDVLPVLFPVHVHQSGMMKEIANKIGTEFLLYVEQDTPLVDDMTIDWEKVKEFIRSGKANVVRFHFEAFIPEPHKHLMIGEPVDGFLATKQWSQRPHLSRTDFYCSIMTLFSEKANCFIEDFAYGQCVNGKWDQWKVWIYHPEGSIKRSYHTDGRAGDRKFEAEQIFK